MLVVDCRARVLNSSQVIIWSTADTLAFLCIKKNTKSVCVAITAPDSLILASKETDWISLFKYLCLAFTVTDFRNSESSRDLYWYCVFMHFLNLHRSKHLILTHSFMSNYTQLCVHLRDKEFMPSQCTYVFLPMTLLAKEALFSVAKPRSPIFTEPVGPVMKILSHFRSLWMMGGALVCRKWRPLRICLHHERRTLIFITLKRLR